MVYVTENLGYYFFGPGAIIAPVSVRQKTSYESISIYDITNVKVQYTYFVYI